MNETNIVALSKLLNQTASPQLRMWAYVEWAGLLLLVVGIALAILFLRSKKEQINEALYPDGYCLLFGLCVCGFAGVLLLFAINTGHVLTTPELCGLKDLFEHR